MERLRPDRCFWCKRTRGRSLAGVGLTAERRRRDGLVREPNGWMSVRRTASLFWSLLLLTWIGSSRWNQHSALECLKAWGSRSLLTFVSLRPPRHECGETLMSHESLPAKTTEPMYHASYSLLNDRKQPEPQTDATVVRCRHPVMSNPPRSALEGQSCPPSSPSPS